ncbi:DNA-3-methyladenine glycosylase, partial [Candidatus Azambacteria bacterium]|nr:DNA-3-methyladenine glycosylase [Candidatus Azambacteria bacterium]
YGMHYMLNIVTGPKGYPAAVLIRGVIKTNMNHSLIRTNERMIHEQDKSLMGPGRLTKALKIDKRLNTKPASYASGLWIAASAKALASRRKIKIIRTPRIGVSYAGEWAKKPLRYLIKDRPKVN